MILTKTNTETFDTCDILIGLIIIDVLSHTPSVFKSNKEKIKLPRYEKETDNNFNN